MFSRFFLLIILILTFINSLGSHLLSQSTHFLENQHQVIKTDKESDLTFIDIKTSGFCHALRGAVIAGGLLYLKCMENKIPIFYRTGLGFYHSNFSMLFFPEMTTIRLTLGLDFTEIDMFVKIFQTLDIFNQKSKHSSKNKR